MLFTYLEHTRKQPEEVRKRKALFLTILVTGLIVVMYLITLYFRVVGTRPSTEEREVQRETNSTEEKFNASNVFTGELSAPEQRENQDELTAPKKTTPPPENPFGF